MHAVAFVEHEYVWNGEPRASLMTQCFESGQTGLQAQAGTNSRFTDLART